MKLTKNEKILYDCFVDQKYKNAQELFCGKMIECRSIIFWFELLPKEITSKSFLKVLTKFHGWIIFKNSYFIRFGFKLKDLNYMINYLKLKKELETKAELELYLQLKEN